MSNNNLKNESEAKTDALDTMLKNILSVVSKMDGRIENIESKMETIDELKAIMSSAVLRIQGLENEVSTIKTYNNKLEGSVEGLENLFDSMIDKCTENRTEIDELKHRLKQIACKRPEKEYEEYKEKIKQLQSDITDLRCRSMKYNLVFTGLRYSIGENIEWKLRVFLENELHINYEVALGQVHRFGKRGLNGARPVVARFLYRQEKEHVLSNAYMLKGKRFGVKEQFPEDIERERKRLYPILNDAKKAGKHVKPFKDKTFH